MKISELKEILTRHFDDDYKHEYYFNKNGIKFLCLSNREKEVENE